MAPTRLASKPIGVNENMNGILGHGITTRSKQLASLKTHKDGLKVPNKRKADSPLKDVTAKRAAFGDITNAINKSSAAHDKDKVMALKKVTVESKVLPILKSIKPQTTTLNGKTSKAKTLQRVATNAIESVQKHFAKDPPKPVATRAQNGILKNVDRKQLGKENQNNSQSSAKSPSDTTKEECKAISEKLNKVNLDDTINRSLDEETESPHKVPSGVPDFDLENWNDPFQVSNYAMDIFNYLKGREPQKDQLTKEELQLLGASALFISSKFDERIPPLVDDFLYICDGAYTLSQLLKMEMNILRVIDFDLGVPLSYRFLRRYARQCLLEYTLVQHSDSKMAAAALYLALRMKSLGGWTATLRYYTARGSNMRPRALSSAADEVAGRLDCHAALLHRSVVPYCRAARGSNMRPRALALRMKLLGGWTATLRYYTARGSNMRPRALALRMKSLGGWTATLRYYTGYSLQDILPVVLEQNATLHKKPKSAISTVRNKYSHTIFFEVAKVPLLEDSALSS
ncbi:unnamed protein product [Chilo suppressalis]|uniref:G2/mitotic-specific cyclin-B3 n=1 Tax=Chilo suppressalis TaxID=168631 RepID=A0ABN8BB81_CHISP|nr:unnamed protein product [Chilo suppressalis]